MLHKNLLLFVSVGILACQTRSFVSAEVKGAVVGKANSDESVISNQDFEHQLRFVTEGSGGKGVFVYCTEPRSENANSEDVSISFSGVDTLNIELQQRRNDLKLPPPLYKNCIDAFRAKDGGRVAIDFDVTLLGKLKKYLENTKSKTPTITTKQKDRAQIASGGVAVVAAAATGAVLYFASAARPLVVLIGTATAAGSAAINTVIRKYAVTSTEEKNHVAVTRLRCLSAQTRAAVCADASQALVTLAADADAKSFTDNPAALLAPIRDALDAAGFKGIAIDSDLQDYLVTRGLMVDKLF